MYFSISLCGISLFVAVLANEYCYEDLCSEKRPHIACDYSGGFERNCPKDAILLDMNYFKEQILDELNSLRSTLANGKLLGFPSAKGMATMQWDDELADLATMNVQRCTLSSDCHNTETYMFSGQNVYRKIAAREMNPEEQVTNAITSWWSHYKNCTRKDIEKYNLRTPKIGRFTCLAAELNIAVGCAIASYRAEGYTFLFTCNFANCNVIGQPVYVAGPTASACTTGSNPQYDGLCSENEEYEVNFIY